jgi:hypothetical protein
MISFLYGIFEALFQSTGYGSGLNTKKIDKNIELLKEQDWFKELYAAEMYHRLFFVNKHVRGYLQSSYRVKRIIHNQEARKKFILLLDKQIKC